MLNQYNQQGSSFLSRTSVVFEEKTERVQIAKDIPITRHWILLFKVLEAHDTTTQIV